MKRITLFLTTIYIVAAQMTFTDNWDKRTLPNLFRGWEQEDRMVNKACNWDFVAEFTRELQQIYKRQDELINLINKCITMEHPVLKDN